MYRSCSNNLDSHVAQNQIIFVNLIPCPEGLDAPTAAHPEIKVGTAEGDAHLSTQREGVRPKNAMPSYIGAFRSDARAPRDVSRVPGDDTRHIYGYNQIIKLKIIACVLTVAPFGSL